MSIKVEIDEHVRECDHCGAKNIKRTFHVITPEHDLYIGRICIERITNINTSGNPYRARDKIQKYLRSLEPDDLADLMDSLTEE